MDKISRRSFFRRTAAAGAAGAVIMAKGAASANAATGQPMATVIDLTLRWLRQSENAAMRVSLSDEKPVPFP